MTAAFLIIIFHGYYNRSGSLFIIVIILGAGSLLVIVIINLDDSLIGYGGIFVGDSLR